MSALADPIEEAAPAPAQPRPSRVLIISYLAGAPTAWPRSYLYSPTPVEAAKKICQSLMVTPGDLSAKPKMLDGFPVQICDDQGFARALVGCEPEAANLAAHLNRAFAQLAAEKWWPIPPLHAFTQAASGKDAA